MKNALEQVDNQAVALAGGDGEIFVSNRLQGRIFATIDGVLLHRFDAELAKSPGLDFNNLGGNSLWPAPEGGKFAFNYPSDGGPWRVQDGVNSVPTVTRETFARGVVIGKSVELENRGGKVLKLDFSRRIETLADSELIDTPNGVKQVGYRSIDAISPLEKYSASEALFAAWSLEQFPGAEGVIAFGRCDNDVTTAINDDFYGSAAERLSFDDSTFQFRLGGEKRLQIALKTRSTPRFIGALDFERGLLIVRSIPTRTDGKYFNIADNEQKSGPFGASDMYSVFNGSRELNFFELETIAPAVLNNDGTLATSKLESTTWLFTGNSNALKELAREKYGVNL